jgi:membrane protease YdiL (CAAX protease family)
MSDSGWPGTPGQGGEAFPPRPDAPFPPAPSSALSPVPMSPDGRPRSTWRWWEALIVFFLGLVAGGLVGAAVFVLLGRGHAAEVAVNVIGEIVPGGLLLLWLRAYHPGWQRAIGFPPRSRLLREIGAGVLAGIVLYLGIAFGVAAILTAVFEQASGKAAKTPEQLPTLSGIGILFAVLLAIVAAPMVEELFFRGCVFRSLRDRHGFPLAAIVSALLFGLVHYVPGPWQDTLLLMTIMVFTGFGLAWFYDRRGNLVASIAAHATFNTIGLILILSVR